MSPQQLDRRIADTDRRLNDLRRRLEGEARLDSLAQDALEELGAAMEELTVAAEELRQQNDELVASRCMVEDERRRYAELFEAAPDAYLVTDASGRIVEANQAAKGLLGGGGELVGAYLSTLVADADRYRYARAIGRIKEAAERESLDMRVDPAGGAPVPVHATGAAARDAAGEIVGVRWILTDITELKRAQDELAAERAQLQAIILSAPEAIVVADEGARIVFTNPAADRLYARPVPYGEDCERHEELQITDPEGAPIDPRELPLTRSALDGETVWGQELAIRWPDGQRRDLLVNSSPIKGPSGEATGAMGMFQDVTEIRRLARALAVERDVLGAIMENTRTHLAYLDRDLNFVMVNSTYAEGCGHAREELIGRNHFELFPNDENQAIFERVLDACEPVSFVAKPFVFPDRPDQISYWDWTLTPVCEGDEVRGLVLSLLDVTGEVERRLQREDHMARLEALIRVSREVLAEDTVEGLLQRIADAARELVGARLAASGHGRQGGAFRMSAASGEAPRDRLEAGGGAAHMRLLEDVGSIRLTQEELARHPDWPAPPEGHRPLRGLVGARLVGRAGRAEGLILATDKRKGEFTQEDEAALSELAAVASLGLGHIEARLEAEARTEALERAERELERHAEHLEALVHERTAQLTASNQQLRQEIAERAEAERELARSEEAYRSLFEDSRDAIIVATMDGRYIDANQAALETLGCSWEELAEMNASEWYVDPADRQRMREGIERRGYVRDFEARLRRKDGAEIDCSFTAMLREEEGGARHMRGFMRDVTEHKRQDREIRQRAHDQTALFDASQALLAEADEPALLATACRLAVERFGLRMAWAGLVREGDPRVWPAAGHGISEGDLAALNVRWDESPRGRGPTGESIRTGRATAADWSAQSPSDEHARRYIEKLGYRASAALPLSHGDEMLGALNVYGESAGNVSEERLEVLQALANLTAANLYRARLHREVRESAARLEERVAERTARLREINAELESFTYSVSHDLRAPLRAMEGFGNALMEDHHDRLDEEGREYLERIVGAARRMDGMIRDLLSYSRLTSSELRIQPTSLSVVVEDARAQLEAQLEEAGAELIVEEPLPAVQGHRATLDQIVANLLSNAIKFVAPGAVPRVRIWAEEREGGARLWVEDNGIGIAPEHQERIFRIFERLHGVESYPGTGIGLAIVTKAVARLGGTMGVQSQPGEGSRFWVELPGARGEASDA